MEFFSATELFRSLDKNVLKQIAENCEVLHVASGKILVAQGEPGDSVYFVVYGRLRAFTLTENGEKNIVGEIGRGECMGEMAIFTDEVRSATVYAIRDSVLLKLSKSQFEALMIQYPQAMTVIIKLIIKRLQKSLLGPAYRVSISTIAVVPLTHGTPVQIFIQKLIETLKKNNKTVLHLNHQRILSKLANDYDLTAWLNEQEARYNYVIYEAGPQLNNWTQQCLRQADRILLVSHFNAKNKLNFTNLHGYSLARQELVLLHEDKSNTPHNTRHWLKQLKVADHHHIMMDESEDYARLVRRLTGHAIGLVLGGGGARGFAHIGVIRALEEAKIPIDIVGGTSMGAFVAAAYAMGWDYEKMFYKIQKVYRNPWSLFDFTLPMVSLLAGRKASKIVKELFGNTYIEDLWKKFFCISSNLTRARVMVHERGKLAESVRASGALPGVVPPVIQGGDFLVDGGVLNNLPVDVMNRFCDEGPVIAVDVSSSIDLEVKTRYRDSLSGWKVLYHKMNPFVKSLNVPHLIDILMRTTELSSVALQHEHLRMADLYLAPPVKNFGILEFDAAEQIINIGYKFARKKINEWQTGFFKF